jgi:hypothetical protein
MAKGRENLLRRYLLGQLPEAEQEALESQFFADAERLDEVWALENQLIDEYVRERLAQPERAQFEQSYLVSPRHRERVALARQLLKVVDEAAAQPDAAAPHVSPWASFWAQLRGSQLAWGLALATVLLLASGVWLLRERAHQRAALAAAQLAQQQREADLANQLAVAQARNEQLAAELAEKERAPQVEVEKAPAAQAPARTLSFFLTASLLRGSSAPQSLTIPRRTQQVELKLRLASKDYPAYQAQLRTVEGGLVWNRQNIKPAGLRVAITVPAAKLPAGDYILTLTGVTAAREAEEVNRYFFRVAGQ